FRDAFARGQRCVVPVDAFYEWKKIGAAKQPYAIVGADGLPLAMAGLWERWKDRASSETVQTFTIVTTAPNELCGAIHDRMPVILPREKWAAWLGEREADADELRWGDPPAVSGGADARLSGWGARRQRAEQRRHFTRGNQHCGLTRFARRSA